MEMNHEPVYDNMPMMNSGSTPISKSLSPADDPEVKRARKILLITLIICLVSFYCISWLLLDDDVKTGSKA